jgi:hypothetical protein
MHILNFQRWKLPPSNFSMTFKDSIWKEDILHTNVITNNLLKRLKILEEIFHTSRKLDVFNNLRTFLPHTSNIQRIEELSSIHFLKIQCWNSQQLEELSSKHFHLETWYFQKLEKQVFPHLKNLQHFEEISSTPPIHLEMDSYFLCNLANQKPSFKMILPFYVIQAKPLTTSCSNTMSLLLLGVSP